VYRRSGVEENEAVTLRDFSPANQLHVCINAQAAMSAASIMGPGMLQLRLSGGSLAGLNRAGRESGEGDGFERMPGVRVPIAWKGCPRVRVTYPRGYRCTGGAASVAVSAVSAAGPVARRAAAASGFFVNATYTFMVHFISLKAPLRGEAIESKPFYGCTLHVSNSGITTPCQPMLSRR